VVAGSRGVRSLRSIAADYTRPDGRRAAVQLLVTVLPFLALLGGLLYALDNGVWPALLLTIPGAALLVRLFMIQHDCGHGSFFRSRRANDWLGRAIGVATLTPYAYWRKNHAVHHATAGNLDRRGVGDVTTLTVREYLSSPAWRRLAYRLYRHPLIMFGVGPVYLFLVRHRIPSGSPLCERQGWISVLGTNAMIVLLGGLISWSLGIVTFLLGCLPIILLAAAVGVWLFYIQHQFEDTYGAAGPRWEFQSAALEGCSYYDLPRLLHWMTANIGFHHIHHLSSRIPSYRLRDCFDQNPEFRSARRLTLRGGFGCMWLSLWDEDSRRLVSFRHVAQRASTRFGRGAPTVLS
jgi:omega-6 fatty acid desaturase (delta-12 desaturase)